MLVTDRWVSAVTQPTLCTTAISASWSARIRGCSNSKLHSSGLVTVLAHSSRVLQQLWRVPPKNSLISWEVGAVRPATDTRVLRYALFCERFTSFPSVCGSVAHAAAISSRGKSAVFLQPSLEGYIALTIQQADSEDRPIIESDELPEQSTRKNRQAVQIRQLTCGNAGFRSQSCAYFLEELSYSRFSRIVLG